MEKWDSGEGGYGEQHARRDEQQSGHHHAQGQGPRHRPVDDEWKNNRAHQGDAGDGQEHTRRHELHAMRCDAAAQEAAQAGSQQQREQRHGQRVHRMSKQQDKALEQCDLEQHEAGAEGTEVDQPSTPPRRRARADQQRSEDKNHDEQR